MNLRASNSLNTRRFRVEVSKFNNNTMEMNDLKVCRGMRCKDVVNLICRFLLDRLNKIERIM